MKRPNPGGSLGESKLRFGDLKPRRFGGSKRGNPGGCFGESKLPFDEPL